MKVKVKSLLLMACLLATTLMSIPVTGTAKTEIKGTVSDPKGALVVNATVTLINQKTGGTKTVLTDDKGSFLMTGLQPGTYTLGVAATGFQSVNRPDVQLTDDQSLSLDFKLEIARPVEKVDVSSTPADPMYAKLREVGVSGETAAVENIELKRDAGRFQLKRGTFYFLTPVMDRVTGAVFVGEGRFLMRPPTPIERNHLQQLLEGAEDPTQVNEPFEQAIFYFTDKTYAELKTKAKMTTGSVPDSVKGIFKDHQYQLRRELRSNIELRILSDLYSPSRSGSSATYPGLFNAFIKGQKNKKLIYVTDPLGAVPDVLSPEEVGLISFDPNSYGIWSLFHYENEYMNNTATSDPTNLEYDISHFRIESVIDRAEQLTALAQVTLTPRMPGLRVFRFDLYPRLRVSRVLDETGTPLSFIQADHEEGGAFAVIYPEPLAQRASTMTIEYRGPEAVRDSGGGNFILNPAARGNWYPNNWQYGFGDRATFDLTFRIPGNLVLVANGNKVRDWQEDKFAATQWISDFPLAVAGFNYGDFRVLEKKDKEFDIGVFTNKSEPDEIRAYQHTMDNYERQGATIEAPLGSLSTAGLANSSMVEAINSVRIYNQYFGDNPYKRIAMSQQPAAFFGQSWPMLVYMPYIAFLDATQRMSLGMSNRISEFTDVVGPHEIAHQWWGHLVNWKTYHDQWLSEGFAEFSASLYLLYAYDKDPLKRQDRFLKFWEEVRKRVIQKVPLGIKNTMARPNDVGPIWLGSRLETARTGGAYNYLIYSKGAFILHMLRMLMSDSRAQPGHQDDRFIAMMRDFVQTFMHQGASTEDFKRIVEKHMTQDMDQDGNGKMDWFFDQWVYGTDLPHYKVEYGYSDSGGKPVLNLTITQSNVSDTFKMPIPIYLDYGKGKMIRLVGRITGNSSVSQNIPLLEKPKTVKLCANYDVLCVIEEAKSK